MAGLAPIPFSLGVNYPWRNYGEDFGRTPLRYVGVNLPETQNAIAADFAEIHDAGASVVRWFLFADGRGGFLADNGVPRAPDDSLFADVGAALQLAQRCELKLCFSLIDFLWLQDHTGTRDPQPNDHVLHFPAGREAFLLNVLIPLFKEFCGHPALFAWEIANEPEWAIPEFNRDPAAKLHLADFRAYAKEIAQAIKEFARVPVTLGSARLMWVRAWSELPLDFFEAHYYPSTEKETNASLAQQLADLAALDRPLWLGELPARDTSGADYSLTGALDQCRAAGLCGAAVWRWTKPEAQGSDVAIGQVDPAQLLAWSGSERADAQNA